MTDNSASEELSSPEWQEGKQPKLSQKLLVIVPKERMEGRQKWYEAGKDGL